MADPITYVRERRAAHLDELKELLRIPSVSAQPEHADDMTRAAEWLADRMRDAGLENVDVLPTGGHPVVYGDWLNAGPDAPTVLVYGHYDVQPPEPLDLWDTPPFEPTLRDGKLYARGATDDKGQMYTHVKGVEAHLKATGRIPVNVKFLVEGEEEVGSENLDAFIEREKERLRADVVLISDTAMWDEKHPAITYSLRGLCYFFIDAKAAKSDLHSGTFGGAVPNAAEWMAKLLASAKDPDTGRVLVPGFYDDVETREDERAALAKLPFDREHYKEEVGVDDLYTEEGFTPIEGAAIRPTFEVNGVWGGYTGKGAKTVLPNEAHAKVSCRLVANQDPRKIGEAVKRWVADFEKRAPGVRFTIEQAASNPPAKVAIDHPAMQAASRALDAAFPGGEVVFSAEGGSIPVVATFQEKLGIPSVLMGFGLHDENLHAPNEHFRVRNYERGIEASARFWDEVSKM